jgi:hypothetical protein
MGDYQPGTPEAGNQQHENRGSKTKLLTFLVVGAFIGCAVGLAAWKFWPQEPQKPEPPVRNDTTTITTTTKTITTTSTASGRIGYFLSDLDTKYPIVKNDEVENDVTNVVIIGQNQQPVLKTPNQDSPLSTNLEDWTCIKLKYEKAEDGAKGIALVDSDERAVRRMLYYGMDILMEDAAAAKYAQDIENVKRLTETIKEDATCNEQMANGKTTGAEMVYYDENGDVMFTVNI